MTTPLDQLLAQVPSLNNPAEPFVFSVEGDTIVGQWDIVSAKTLYPTEFATIDKDFKVIIKFDEGKGTWKPTEKTSDSGFSVRIEKVGFGTSSTSFSGKSTTKQFGFTLGGISKTDDGISPVVEYSFDSDRIKKPLYDFLEQNGWARKKGLFG